MRTCLIKIGLALFGVVLFAGHAAAQRYWSGAGLNPATAGSGTWDNANMQWSSTFPGYTAAVWNSNIANFNGTGGGTVTIGQAINVNAINFGANAGAFTLVNSGGFQPVNVNGAGIANSSANIQSITNNGFFSSTQFFNSATAANVTINNIGDNSFASFVNSSTAANAIIINSGTALGVDFGNTATAANATIINSATTSRTLFFDMATAGNATIINSGGFTGFQGSAMAGSATITNSALNSETDFTDSTTAENATITNSGTNSRTAFLLSASGGNASLINANPTASIDISLLTTTGTTAGSIAGNGFLSLGGKNLRVGSNNTSTTFSGVIQDGGLGGGTGGSFTKVGTGALILTGNNTYTGGTTISAGTLIVGNANALGSPNVQVPNQTNLNGGTLRTPEGMPLIYNVPGDFNANGGTLLVQVGGPSAGQHDLMQVNNTANVNGGGDLFVHRINGYNPTRGTMVEIITANTAVNGPFDNAPPNAPAPSDFPGLIKPFAVYNSNDVTLDFEFSNSFASQALTRNQGSVADELDEVANDPKAAELLNFLGFEPMAKLPKDYDLIAPEELASIYEISFSQAVIQNEGLIRRMDDIRAGASGFCPMGFSQPAAPPIYSKESDGKTALDKAVTPTVIPCPENHWGVWVNGSGNFVTVDNDDHNAPGYEISNGSVTVGADYRLSDHFAIGIDSGYFAGRAELVNHGHLDMDGGRVGGYATFFGKGLFGSTFYVDVAGGGGWNGYDSVRTGLDDIAVTGSTDGSEWNALLSYGSDWTFGCVNVGTWSTVQYTDVQFDGFTERGSLAPLEFSDQDEDSIRTTTGMHISIDQHFGNCGIVRPELRAAWLHEYGDRAYPIDARFASGAGDVFRVWGPTIGRDAALVGAGLHVQWNTRVSSYVYYDGVLGRSNYDNNAVSGGMTFKF